MLAQIIPVDPLAPSPAVLARMAAVLCAGDLVAFPTETVYGLGADATNPSAVAKIFAAKGRPATDPLIVHIADLAMLSRVTGCALAALPPIVAALVARFWPGPLTLILPRGPEIPFAVTAHRDTVAVRWPAHPVAEGLIRAAGVPIAAPSANRFGHTSPTTAQHVFADLGDRIGWILDAGPTLVGVESTILDVQRDPPRLLRPGGVPREAIEAALGFPIAYTPRVASSETGASDAPGMLLSHYAPLARLIVFEGADLAATWERAIAEAVTLAKAGQRVGVLAPSSWIPRFIAVGITAIAELGDETDPAAVAQRLFAALRELDDAGVEVIVTGAIAPGGMGLAVRDRLWRAAGGRIVPVG